MKIGGVQKLTLIDYPGKTACTVFLSGCNFRCPWCYSPELVLHGEIEHQPQIKEEEFFSFLGKRKNKLEGVVICGGEPTVETYLQRFLEKIKEDGFLVKLDTNGSNPQVLKNLFYGRLVDYVAMDVKLPLERYEETGFFDKEKIRESIEMIKESAPDYEFRTTVVPGVHGNEDIKKIGETIKGAKRHFIQNFLPQKTLDGSFLLKDPFSEKELEEFKKTMEEFVFCEIRR